MIGRAYTIKYIDNHSGNGVVSRNGGRDAPAPAQNFLSTNGCFTVEGEKKKEKGRGRGKSSDSWKNKVKYSLYLWYCISMTSRRLARRNQKRENSKLLSFDKMNFIRGTPSHSSPSSLWMWGLEYRMIRNVLYVLEYIPSHRHPPNHSHEP